ncbi:MAG: recombinase family protein [Clostridiaceae bacterium]|nr:recombinase family protein [Clostridiaceae bacterium]
MEQLRAAIYCRCSTEEESQADALLKQVAESEYCVQEQGWYLADRYVESKSGTTTRGRSEYNRLFDDLQTDKWDVIVIKSQDRLMRNVKDWYLFLDRMLTQGKRLFMYIDRKFYTADDALITGIKAILAEEYSRELSKKINNAHHNRQKNGGKAILTSRVFGFKKNPDGSVSVVESEAEVIRQIYEYCAAGYGSRAIANILLNKGVKKRSGSSLSGSFIGGMIRNPLYKGVMVLNRLHYDFETKQTIKNPESQWIYKTNMVPAIVSEELWDQANLAMTDRAERFSRKGVYRKGGSAGKYDLSGKLICGSCGSPYYRTFRRGCADKRRDVVEWKCSNYLEHGRKKNRHMDNIRKVTKQFQKGCDNIHLEEDVLFPLLEQVSTRYFDLKSQDKEGIINHAIILLKNALSERKSDCGVQKLEDTEKKILRQKDILLNKLLDGIITDQDYQKKSNRMEEELDRLRNQREAVKQREWEIKNLEQRIENITARLRTGGIERAAVLQMLKDIQKIVIYEWHLEICFHPFPITGLPNAGVSQDIAADETASEKFMISVPYPFSPATERGRHLDRERIVKIMKENPDTTARKIAQEMDRPLKQVQNRIKELRADERIRFNGRGGHGVWEVLK